MKIESNKIVPNKDEISDFKFCTYEQLNEFNKDELTPWFNYIASIGIVEEMFRRTSLEFDKEIISFI